MNQEYVAGFLFSPDRTHVALIRKNRPAWQRGCLNGIGGHVEAFDESLHAAMQREFREETGVEISTWTAFARISEEGQFGVTFYFAVGETDQLATTTDEAIWVVGLNDLNHHRLVDNLSWLIPLALDVLDDARPTWTEVTYPKRST